MNKFAGLKHEPDRKNRLSRAIETGDEAEAIRLIEETDMKPADFNMDSKSFILRAIQRNQLRVVEALIKANADLNTFQYYGGGEGHTPLYQACILKNNDIVYALLQAGARVDLTRESNDACISLIDEAVKAKATPASGGRKKTRKHRKSKRHTRRK